MPETPELARRLAALERLGLERAAPQRFDHAIHIQHDWKVSGGRPALGSFVDVTVIDRSERRASDGVALAFQEMERLRAVYDRHDAASALSALNDGGHLDDAPRELLGLFAQSRRFSVASHAAFDVTVAPLVDLYRAGRAAGRAEPSDREIAERRAVVGYELVHVEGRRIAFDRAGMRVTLDAIAKGAIVDAMARVLELHGLTRWLVNAGGDIRAAGAAERGGAWTVAVRDPAAPGNLPGAIAVRDGAVATSGSYDLTRGGAPEPRDIVNGAHLDFPGECASVTVVAPSASAADALATTVVALGPRAGIALIERLRCACLIILPDGRQARSSTWKETSA